MSTTTVNSPKKRGNKHSQAKWDDDRTRLFLELIDIEILAGNRPNGVLTKMGWKNVVAKFNEKTGMAFTRDQLKNKQDNLRREYTKWESLIGKETGLGWDPDRRTLTAPDEWWIEKARSDPTILKYKECGPIHLELFQKIFGGVTATGYRAYVPEWSSETSSSDQPHLESIHEDVDINNNGGQSPIDLTIADQHEPIALTPVAAGPSTNVGKKRKRRGKVSKVSQADIFHSDMESMTQTMRDSLEALNSRRASSDTGLTYEDALALLADLPGMGNANPAYWKAIRVLEDKVRRIAFAHVLKSGVTAVEIWLSTFPDVF